jgi:dTDP-4-dehydrorhamnose 3,5-epimerase-like enzyme
MLVFERQVYGDMRGHFVETFSSTKVCGVWPREAIPAQDNFFTIAVGVLRGLHLQNPRSQGKLVTVLRGRVLDVAVDVRMGSSLSPACPPRCGPVALRSAYSVGVRFLSALCGRTSF